MSPPKTGIFSIIKHKKYFGAATPAGGQSSRKAVNDIFGRVTTHSHRSGVRGLEAPVL